MTSASSFLSKISFTRCKRNTPVIHLKKKLFKSADNTVFIAIFKARNGDVFHNDAHARRDQLLEFWPGVCQILDFSFYVVQMTYYLVSNTTLINRYGLCLVAPVLLFLFNLIY